MLVVLDIDQTIADGRRRAFLAGPEPDRVSDPYAYEMWKNAINEGLEHDQPIPGMRELALRFKDCAVYITARGEDLRDKTQWWLLEHGFPVLRLYMREAGNVQRSAQFKESVILELLHKKAGPVLAIDDDELQELEQVCAKRGWTFLKSRSAQLTESKKD